MKDSIPMAGILFTFLRLGRSILMKRKLALLMTLGLVAGVVLTACGSKDSAKKASDAAGETEAEPDTGDASLDNPRNQDEIGPNEILVVSFGTSYNDSRRETIGAIEQAIEDDVKKEHDGSWSVRRAFTSQIIIDHVNERDNEKIDNVTEALDRAVDNNV